MTHPHVKVQCSCGKVISNCRCMSPDKIVRVIKDGCSECQAKKKD